jgi:hypothetical protein
MARAFKAREVLAAVLHQFVGRDGLAGLELDEGAGRLAPFIIELGNDRRRRNGGMFVKRVLDLNGRNILAAGNDDVLRPVLELDIAVGMHDTEIAGVKPAAGKGIGGRLRIFQIALHHDIAAEHDFADRFAVMRHRPH